MKILTRLMIGFGAVVLLILVVGTIAIRDIEILGDYTENLYKHPYIVTTSALEARSGMIAMHRSMKDAVLSQDEAGLEKAVADVNARETAVLASLKAAGEGFLGDKALIADATKTFVAWKPIRDDVITNLRQGKRAEAVEITKARGANQVAAVDHDLTALVDFSKAKALDFYTKSNADQESIRTTMQVAMVALLVGGLAVAVVITRSITGPLGRLRGCMEQLARNELSATVPHADQRNEIGDMARTVEVFKQGAQEIRRLQADQEATKRRTEDERRAMLSRLADDFEGHIEAVVQHVSAAATEMNATSGSMAAISEECSRQAQAAAAAAEQASSNVETVAAAAEELSASIGEIGRQVATSATTSHLAVDKARRTNDIVQSLAEAANRIGQVVQLINDIASQTNLLALNATIEAARAGDAGKGFAVVANEVKTLANQTAKATDEIANQINAVQGATQQAVVAIQDIVTTIGELSSIATTIAGAVEEQQASTREIARNVEQAASGTSEVARSIAGVNQAADEAGRASEQVLTEARDLSKQSETLRLEVDGVLLKIRTA